MLGIDDDDTTPTENADVLSELTATLAASPLTVLEWGTATTPGMRRRVNEDAWGHRDQTFAIADGMGGRAAARWRRAPPSTGSSPALPTSPDDWRSVVAGVNDDVVRAGADRGIDRLGTTLLAAVVGGPLVTLIHLGDSRAYRLTDLAGDDAPASTC